MRPELKLILASVSLHPSEVQLKHVNHLLTEVVDWVYFEKISIERGLAPLFYQKIKLLSNQHLIPDSTKLKLKKTYYATLSRNFLIYTNFQNLITELNHQHIPSVALKGIYLAEWLYGDIGLRQMSDIDLLINPDNSKAALSALDKLGYKVSGSEHDKADADKPPHAMHFKPRVLNTIPVEIHTKLQAILNDKGFEKQTKKVLINNVEINVLQDYEQLIHLCVHLHKHFEDGHVQFTCFADVVIFIEKFSESFNWSAFETVCEQYQVVNMVFRYIILVEKYFSAAVPMPIIEKYKHCLTIRDEKLFEKYLAGFESFNSLNPKVIAGIRSSKSIKTKLKYMLSSTFILFIVKMLFPTKMELTNKYNISLPSLYVLWYPRWYLHAINGFIKMLLK